MLSTIEETLLKEFLSYAPVSENSFTYHEIMGFMFGLTITPEKIPEEEWMVAIFGNDDPDIDPMDQVRSMHRILHTVFLSFEGRRKRGELQFPYQLETMEKNDLTEVLEWVSGFEEALALRPELWEPDNFPRLLERKQEELFFSMMVIHGLIDPIEMLPFFEKLPDEVFAEVFETGVVEEGDREMKVQAFLIATLPLAVETLLEHAQGLEQQQNVLSSSQTLFSHRTKEKSVKRTKDDGSTKKKSSKQSKIIQVDFLKRKKKVPKPQVPSFQLKISLKRAKPPIWRRVLVPGDINLAQLHEIIQIAMGWQNLHLHQFMIQGRVYQPADDETIINLGEFDEVKYTLTNLTEDISPYFDYLYDFGDNWEHRITVEKILEGTDAVAMPKVIKGKMACPPEDVGGMAGYTHFLEILNDPSHKNYEEYLSWAGPDFDPKLFDGDEIEEINKDLQAVFGP